jgi:hypothetical protein
MYRTPNTTLCPINAPHTRSTSPARFSASLSHTSPLARFPLGNSSASALYDLDLLRFIHKHPIDAAMTACTNSNSPCSLSKVVATMPQVLIMQASLGDFYILLASHPTNGL